MQMEAGLLDGLKRRHVPSRHSGQGTPEIQMWAGLVPSEAVSWLVDLCLHVYVAFPLYGHICVQICNSISHKETLRDRSLPDVTHPNDLNAIVCEDPLFLRELEISEGHIPTQQ